MRKAFLVLVASLALPVGWSGPAHAGPTEDRRECLSSAEKAQRLRKSGNLKESRDKLVVCARASCPAVVRKDCEDWLGEVEALLPSVVVTAKDVAGKEVVEVRVSIDDKPMTERLDGKAIEVDPGVHTFRYDAQGLAPVINQIVIREGERARPLEVNFEGPSGANAPGTGAGAKVVVTPTSARGAPVAAIVFGALGVVGIGTFVFFHLSAASDRDDLRSTCAPACDPNAVDDVNRKVIVSDVALGAGVVALGVAAYLLITRPSAAAAAKTTAILPVLGTTPSGALSGLRVRF